MRAPTSGRSELALSASAPVIRPKFGLWRLVSGTPHCPRVREVEELSSELDAPPFIDTRDCGNRQVQLPVRRQLQKPTAEQKVPIVPFGAVVNAAVLNQPLGVGLLIFRIANEAHSPAERAVSIQRIGSGAEVNGRPLVKVAIPLTDQLVIARSILRPDASLSPSCTMSHHSQETTPRPRSLEKSPIFP
jgi:hypothetical protein